MRSPAEAPAARPVPDALTEAEGYDLLDRLGLPTPRRILVPAGAPLPAGALEDLPGDRVVVKVVSRGILHKSEVGGVAVVERSAAAVTGAMAAMRERLAGQRIEGFLVVEYVVHDPAPGGELLVAIRDTADFGPVVSLGLGGVHAEPIAGALQPGREIAVLSPALRSPDTVRGALRGKLFARLAAGGLRGLPPRIAPDALEALVFRLLDIAAEHVPGTFRELEINPLVLTERGPIAIDVLARPGRAPAGEAPPRPLHKLGRLFEPRSVAVMGVSERPNPGHVIVRNLQREGFPPDRLLVVKHGCEEILGCRCVPDLASLPWPVDLLVLAVSAPQVPALLEEIAEEERAETVIVIPGGMGETEASAGLVERVRDSLARSRRTPGGGPLVNGGNCLGIRSLPGHVDTLFIPQYKLGARGAGASPLAFLSQSGAFAVSRAAKLAALQPRYIVSVGNQIDLTLGDYLEWCRGREDVRVIAVYAEGFRAGDGRRALEAAADLTARGRSVILYRAGRTAAGADAAASHTAALAGDHVVTRELARQAGIVVAESLADFDDLVGLFVRLDGRRAAGPRLGAVSNAGFESVAIADSLGGLELAVFGEEATARVRGALARHRLEEIVEVHNPLDVTPILDDAGYEESVRAILDDPGVDLAIVGVVPLTPALQSLPAGEGRTEDLTSEDGIAARLARVFHESTKPWVTVVDGGPLYEPLRVRLEELGVPAFPTADRAMRALGIWRG